MEIGTGARRTPNSKATTVELFDGLEAASQNRWPSLRVDALAINRLGGPFLAAGFYYKTFMWPAAFDEVPTFEMAVARSYAGSFAHWLGASAAEFGLEVAA